MKALLLTTGFITFSKLLSAQDCSIDVSCCLPQPTPCTAYSPQYHALRCDWGIYLTLDFLYWYARENNLVWATKASVQDFGGLKEVASPSKQLHFKAGWRPGIRIGLGCNLGCDGWDLYVNWLYHLHTNDESASSSPDDKTILYNPWVYGSWFEQSFWENGRSRWCLNFDQMDFELGRKFWLSPCFTLRPYAGLRGTWLHTRYHVYTDRNLSTFSRTGTEFIDVFQSNKNLIKNAYWGVGLLGGMQPNWAILKNWFIFGNFSGSLVWGRFWGCNEATSKFEGTLISNLESPVFQDFVLTNFEKEALYRMQAMLDVSLGLRFEKWWCCDRFSTAFDIGWEHHFWLNWGLRHQSTGNISSDPSISYYSTETDLITDLQLGGLVIRVKVDF